MKKILILFVLSVLGLPLWAQYNPDNPGDPGMHPVLTLKASPEVAGSVSPNNSQQVATGAEVTCSASAYSDYVFRQWTVGDQVVSTERRFNFVMPDSNVVMTAHFDYQPGNPADPQEQDPYHTVSLTASPSTAGYFSNNVITVAEGGTATIRAYAYSGYRFKAWTQDGDTLSTNNPLELVMGGRSIQLTALFDYAPENPDNPGEAIPERVATPSIMHAGDVISMSSATEQATIYYTMDGTTPDATSTVYHEPFEVNRNCVIQAIALRENYIPSQVATLEVDWFRVENVTFTQEGRRLSLSTPTEQATIYYSLSTDNAGFVEYTDALTLTGDCTIDAYATRDGYTTSETTRYEFTYSVQGDATFDGRVARVSGERTLDEAFAEAGGRTEAAKTICAIVWEKETAVTEADIQGIDNPNLLLYVADDARNATSVQNVVVNGTAKRIVLTDTGSGNCDFYCPQEFTAENISYTRNFQQPTEIGVCRGWETIALPFNVQTITHEANGVLLPFGVDGNGKPFWLRRLSGNGFVSTMEIEANTPYIISMPNAEEYPNEYRQAGRVTFTAQNAQVQVSEPVWLATDDQNILMAPTFQRKDASRSIWVLNANEPRNGYPEGAVFEHNYRELRPFEAYTVHMSEGPDNPRLIPLRSLLNDNDGATGIIDYTHIIDKGRKQQGIYDLQGRKLNKGTRLKGVYIVNGRKVVMSEP